jgi:hypothetical protein
MSLRDSWIVILAFGMVGWNLDTLYCLFPDRFYKIYLFTLAPVKKQSALNGEIIEQYTFYIL